MAAEDQHEQIREVESFNRVETRDNGELIVRQGGRESLSVESTEDLLPKIRSQVRKGTLVLQVGRNWLERVFMAVVFPGRRKVRYHLTVRELEGVLVKGTYEAMIHELNAPTLFVRARGVGRVEFTALETRRLDVHIHGHTEVEVAGKVIEQDIRLSGSGEFIADQLESRRTRVTIRRHGNATVHVEETLDIDINGLGRVAYRGEPTITQTLSGPGSIQQLSEPDKG